MFGGQRTIPAYAQEDGGNISKGRKQLLTIAPAMLYASQFG